VVDETQADAAVFGLALPELETDDNCEIWEENWSVVEMFLRVQTQWRTTMNGVLGLDYGAVAWILRLYEVENQRSMLEDLQVMEAAAMATLNDRNS
jgi:ABC-type thiamine transport system substrate-binding protein